MRIFCCFDSQQIISTRPIILIAEDTSGGMLYNLGYVHDCQVTDAAATQLGNNGKAVGTT